MRSSSSRNLAGSPNNNRVLRNQIHPQYYRSSSVPHDKYLCMQFMQALLFTTRITFLLYNIVVPLMYKQEIHEHISRFFRGSPRSDAMRSASVGLLSLFLISLIIFTFVYNYMLVHENLPGIKAMSLFPIVALIYYVAAFGRFNSVLESSIVCLASASEIVALIYLITLIHRKKQTRYEQHFERRFSLTNPDDLLNETGSLNRQMPHQRGRIGDKGISATPPSITISFTGADDQRPEEEVADSDQITSSQPDEEEHEKSEEGLHNQAEEGDSREQQSSTHHGHRRSSEKQHSSRSNNNKHHRVIDNESESSASMAEERSLHHPNSHHDSKHTRSRDHLQVPGHFTNQEDDEEADEEDGEEESSLNTSPHHHQTATADQRYQSSSRSRQQHQQQHQHHQQYHQENVANYYPSASPHHHSTESYAPNVDVTSQNYSMQSAHHHHPRPYHQQHSYMQNQQPLQRYSPPQVDYYNQQQQQQQQQQPMYEYSEEYAMGRSANYR